MHDDNVLGDNIGSIALIDSMGGDLSVVNDAKASLAQMVCEIGGKEVKLINYLVENKHFSPLRGTVLKFSVKAPLFICRQWWKHHLASCHSEEQDGWNEQSGRYTSFKPEFYIPKVWYEQSKMNKQGSATAFAAECCRGFRITLMNQTERAFQAYEELLNADVSRESARMILPVNIYTSWVWTVSLQAALNFVELRNEIHAQGEIQRYAAFVESACYQVAPLVTKAYMNRTHV
jgi:thymidylate synthase (FAD)